MKKIKLIQGQVALVSDHRYEELNSHKWHAQWDDNTQSYYVYKKEKGKKFAMHRQIVGFPKGMETDYINHDTLDNQDHNLRIVTKQQNAWNRKTRRDNQVGERNIKRRKGGSYRVEITKHGKVYRSKNFKSLGDAVAARDQMRQELFGDFGMPL